MTDAETTISLSNENGVATVTGAGELDLSISEEFERALASAMESGDEVVVDLRQAYFIDTAIIAALIAPARAMQKRNGRLRVMVTPKSHPAHALRMVKFSDFMDIDAEESSAATEGSLVCRTGTTQPRLP